MLKQVLLLLSKTLLLLYMMSFATTSLPFFLPPTLPASLPPSLFVPSEIDSLIHAMNLINSVDKLVEACEVPSTVRMPQTVHLVKQLRKELNFSDVVKSLRKEGESRDREREGVKGEP